MRTELNHKRTFWEKKIIGVKKYWMSEHLNIECTETGYFSCGSRNNFKICQFAFIYTNNYS